MQIILLAAGRGSRLSKSLRKRPKCLTIINGKTILEHNLKFYLKFKKRFIITGYKSNLIKSFAKKNGFKIIQNKKYTFTNIVYSAFLSSKFVNKDVVLCYSDIIFNPSLFNLLKDKKNIIPVYKNWLQLWKKRMPIKMIKKDAENLIIKKNKLFSIGEKFGKKYPRYQYMGIFKLKKKNFFYLKNFFKKLRNKKIDMTSFLNKAIIEKKVSFIVKKYSSYWYEIDKGHDVKVASKELN